MGISERSKPGSYPGTTLRSVSWADDLDTVRGFFREYRRWLADHRGTAASDVSIATAGLSAIDKQIEELPGVYGPPRGEILLAFAQEVPVACGALRELEPKVGEIKRLYVREDHRGGEFGRRLTGALIDRARELGYRRVRADTLPSMRAAIQFYQELGFDPIPAYWPHPVPGALFFEYKVEKPKPTHRMRKAS